MRDFFVEQIFSGFLVTAFPFAFIAGVISFLSPCVLPLVPGYLSFAAGFSVSRGKVLLGSLLFVLGFSLVFISYGAIFGGLGNQLFTYVAGLRFAEMSNRQVRVNVSLLERGEYSHKNVQRCRGKHT